MDSYTPIGVHGSTLKKPRTLFEETRRIPKKPQGFRQNPTETRESPWSWLRRILKNPLESPGILRNPQKFLGILMNSQESWETSEILFKHIWKPRTKFLKCRAPRFEQCSNSIQDFRPRRSISSVGCLVTSKPAKKLATGHPYFCLKLGHHKSFGSHKPRLVGFIFAKES